MIIELLAQYLFNRLFLYQLTTTLATYSVITTAFFVQKRRTRYALFKYYGIPGPEAQLLDGNLHEFLKEKQGYRVDSVYYKQYGKYYGYFIGDMPVIVITDLDMLKKVFLERMSSFKEREHPFLDTALGYSILFCPNHRWKLMRKVMSPAFNGYVIRGNSSTEFIEQSIRLMLENIEDKFKSAGTSDGGDRKIEIDTEDLMKSVALHMISSMAIKLKNVAVKEGESHVKNLDDYMSSCDKGPVVWAIRFPFLKRILSFIANRFEVNEAMKLIHQSLNSNIDNSLKRAASVEGRELKAEQPQLIDTLIKLLREGRMTRTEVIGNAEAILIAGYDTTSTTLNYIFWVLGKFPDVQERLRNELMAHSTESKYLEQVINETMRLYPTVINFVGRMATETVVIDDLTIPQGSKVVYNAWLMNNNPAIWPEPQKFDPERFREGVERHPCAFAPFGIGERRCLGYQLAQLEMKMIICDVLMRYRIKTKAPQDLELNTYASVLTKPSEKVIVELEKL